MGETFVQRPLVSYQPSSKHGDDVSLTSQWRANQPKPSAIPEITRTSSI